MNVSRPDQVRPDFFHPRNKMSKNEYRQYIGFTKEVNYLGPLVLQSRITSAFDKGVARYPIYRVLRFAARVELEALFDAIALEPLWHAERVYEENVLLEGDG